MQKIYYAKSMRQNGSQPTVREHLDLVAEYAAQYGRPIGMETEARLAGQFHDFGKYSDAFAAVLQHTKCNIDHAICGAAYLYECSKGKWEAVVEAIYGHHDGLVEIDRLEEVLADSLTDPKPKPTTCGKLSALAGRDAYIAAQKLFLQDHPGYILPKCVSLGTVSEIASMLYTRLLFSCLVDADHSVSAYEDNDQYFLETEKLSFQGEQWLANLYARRQELASASTADPTLNQIRDQVFTACGEAGAHCPEGLFTLTAPTGTGKTLALLHFALRHCLATGKKRIILVLPYLTLAEQVASECQKLIPEVLVDHSQSDLSDAARAFATRWSVPFIITTSVKFFETLFAAKPTDCQKLHNIANSVVIFDEAQSLPPEVTSATLQAVNELCSRYHTTMVFSTATQPAFEALKGVTWMPHEILPENAELFAKLRRTTVSWRLQEDTDLLELAEEIATQDSVCVIVNLRRHARTLFASLRDEQHCPPESIFYLTTDLCPLHRTAVVHKIKDRISRGLSCRVVATQCIEAGVDLDFRTMYRALAPLDSIIQAAGRCNRNGREKTGQVVVFRPKDENRIYPSDWYGNAAGIVEIQNTHGTIDIHDPTDIRRYYVDLFKQAKDKTKLSKALKDRCYADVQKEYRLIDNVGVRVIVPYTPCRHAYDAICEEILADGITPKLMKEAAPFTVSCYRKKEELETYAEQIRYRTKEEWVDSDFYVLRPQYISYYQNEDMGLQFPEDGALWNDF